MPVIECPYCDFRIELKGVKPGLFHPACPGCKQKFELKIASVNNAPVVLPMPGVKKTEKLDPNIETALGLDMKFPVPPVSRLQQTAVAPAHEKARVPHASLAKAQTEIPGRYADESPAPADEELHGALGGYEIIHKLGSGGMGSVYLARQVSLDRNVALKVLSPTLARDPQFVARFTREAYAAAQLTHHNIVQIHDIGTARDHHFFSMEYVEGQTLADLVRAEGRLDPEAAVGYVLHAARGLKFAHDHGMIHRDVKPENLLLNNQNIVKVADLGLVKRAGASETRITGVVPGQAQTTSTETQMAVSMGTPAYMPPEQAIDAAKVDQRADIYSLGCTLYVLLTGRPPYSGRTAMEVITKHANEPMVPPDLIDHHIPKTLSAILMKMVAKRPEERYQNLTEVIKALEGFLGVESSGPFSPKEEHVKVLEFAVERFNASTWASIRRWTIRGFFAACTLGTLGAAYFGSAPLAGAIVGFAVIATLVYQIIIGITQKTFLFRKARELIFGASPVDWLTFLVVGALAVGLLWVFGLLLWWIGFGIVAGMVAAAFHFTVDLMVSKDRATPIQQVEAMLKSMRLRGLDENALRQFVSKYAGEYWEEFYEALFGYEAKIVARRAWGKTDRGIPRRKFAAWRDPIIHWIDNKMILRKEARERKHLAKLEAKALQAKGINESLAAKQGKRNAESLVDRAHHIRNTAEKRAAMTALPQSSSAGKTVEIKLVNPQWIHDENVKIETGQEDEETGRKRESYLKRRYGGPLDILLGPAVRFLLAAVILAGFGMWFRQNHAQQALQETEEIASRRRVLDEQTKDIRGKITQAAQDANEARRRLAESSAAGKPLRIKHVPDLVCDAVGSWNGGLAGLLLLVSVFVQGKLLALGVIVSAAIAMLGHRYNVPLLFEKPTFSAIAGGVLGLVSLLFLRERRGF